MRNSFYLIVGICILLIIQDQLSLAASQCRAHARALLWLEEHIRENPDCLQKNIAFLQVSFRPLKDDANFTVFE